MQRFKKGGPTCKALGLLAGKIWLDHVNPRAFANLANAACAFAGTFFILSLLLSL